MISNDLCITGPGTWYPVPGIDSRYVEPIDTVLLKTSSFFCGTTLGGLAPLQHWGLLVAS